MGNYDGKISASEFARRLDISAAAVNKAIAAGHLRESVQVSPTKTIWIDEALAKKEWAETIIPMSQNQKLREKLKEPPTPAPKKRRPEKKATPPAEISTDPPDPPKPVEKGQMSLAEAKRAREILAVRKTNLELQQMEGKLVDKSKVYRALFAFASDLRRAILQVPDQVIDDILATSTRNHAHTILVNALADVLERLSNADDLNFGENG